MTTQLVWKYDRGETVADAVIHILGVTMAIVAAALLVVVAAHDDDTTEVAAVAVYTAGFLAMFSFSAAYNLWPISPIKWWLRRFDHSAIYLLIAATYTAFMLPMRGVAPTALLTFIWIAALTWHRDQALMAGPFRSHRRRRLSRDGLELPFRNAADHCGARAGHARTSRCRWRALFDGRHFSCVDQPALSECDLARFCPCRRFVSLRGRADIAYRLNALRRPEPNPRLQVLS
jgi:Predicted membrane protein, hemolysin III homolog